MAGNAVTRRGNEVADGASFERCSKTGISIEERDAASIQYSNKFEKNYKRLGINIGNFLLPMI